MLPARISGVLIPHFSMFSAFSAFSCSLRSPTPFPFVLSGRGDSFPDFFRVFSRSPSRAYVRWLAPDFFAFSGRSLCCAFPAIYRAPSLYPPRFPRLKSAAGFSPGCGAVFPVRCAAPRQSRNFRRSFCFAPYMSYLCTIFAPECLHTKQGFRNVPLQ